MPKLARALRVCAAVSLVASVLSLGPVGSVGVAGAQASDDFSLTKTDNLDGEVLIGEHVTYTLTAEGDHASGAFLFNLSFRDVLQVGVSFVSADPAPTAVLTDVPALGQTTVIWENVSDLPAGSLSAVSTTVDTNPDFVSGAIGADTVPIGSIVSNDAEAVASTDAFTIPDWDPLTGDFDGDFDGSATASHDVTIIPFRVTKIAPTELLRGVHAAGLGGEGGTEGALYTVEVENNPDYAVDDVTLTDVLNPALEFLGCDTYYGGDNTTVADEWIGAGPVSTGAGCAPTPLSVDTLGTGETEVVWDLGDLTPAEVATVTYQAGIPLFANEEFVGTPPWPPG